MGLIMMNNVLYILLKLNELKREPPNNLGHMLPKYIIKS